MPNTKISDFSATAGSNTDINSVDIAEGMSPSNVNNAIRALTAMLKNDLDLGTNALANPTLTTAKIGGVQMPSADSTAGYVLSTNGSGQASWIAQTSETTTNPTGSVIIYGGTSAPTGWLMCDGSDLNTYTYRVLHAVVSNNFGGTAYNAGVTDQSGVTTTFKLPDMRGRVVAGRESSASNLTSAVGGVDGGAMGATGGNQGITLTSAQSGLPAHTHSASTSTSTSVTNGLSVASSLSFTIYTSGQDGGYSGYHVVSANATSGTSLSVSSSFSGSITASSSSSTTVSNNSASNASSAHANVQPTIILNYIMKT